MTKTVRIDLSVDEALVLFEFFARFDDDGIFRLRNNAEYIAFSKLSAQLDKSLVEPFQSNYQELLEQARSRLAEGYQGTAPGVELDPSHQ